MRILIVGHAGREHAITKAVAASKDNPEIYAWMTSVNPGIVEHCREFAQGSMRDRNGIADYAWEKRVDLVIVGPEEPLTYGAADALQERGIPHAGPPQKLAKLEGDKAFFRTMANKYIPDANARFFTCKTDHEISAALSDLGDAVVKPLGLTSGKGVKVMGTQLPDIAAAHAYASQLLQQDGTVLLEERLVGEEFSQMVFTDGVSVYPLPLCQDAKYAYDGDTGPMTGGMGAYSMPDHLLPFISARAQIEAIGVIERLLAGVQDEFQLRYHGVLYGQFILTRNGPKMVEVNVRLGDPEAINVMLNLASDAVEVFSGVASNLKEKVAFKRQATICKYLVPKSYPEKASGEIMVHFDQRVFDEEKTQLIVAGAEKVGELYRATGSRFTAVYAERDSLSEAEAAVERTISKLALKGLRHRSDIAKPETIQKKIASMRELMGTLDY